MKKVAWSTAKTYPCLPGAIVEITGDYGHASLYSDRQHDTGILEHLFIGAFGKEPVERRRQRQAIARQFYYPPFNASIQIRTIYPGRLPRRHLIVCDRPISINSHLFNPAFVVQELCKFIDWQCGEIKGDRVIFADEGIVLQESSVLDSPGTLTKIYWLTAILSRYCSFLGVR